MSANLDFLPIPLVKQEGMSFRIARILHNSSCLARTAGGLAARWLRRIRIRRLRRELDARQLADMGLAGEEAAAEAAKWFWEE
jgi:uncharacterized protein YjiS (DUF1127 family)